MRIATCLAFLFGPLLLVSCRNNPPHDGVTDAQKEYARDLAQIQSMGLTERAQRDFRSHLTNATVGNSRMGYLTHTNYVWCEVSFRLPGNTNSFLQQLAYTRATGSNWSLVWGLTYTRDAISNLVAWQNGPQPR